MTEIKPGEVIAWESETGLPNRGRVTFVSDGPDHSRVTLAIRFDVPTAVATLFESNFVAQFVESTLLADLKRFRTVVLRKKRMRVQKGLQLPRKADSVVERAMQLLD